MFFQNYAPTFCIFLLIAVGNVESFSSSDVDDLSQRLQKLCSQDLQSRQLSAMLTNTSVQYINTNIDGDAEVKKLADAVSVKLQLISSTVKLNRDYIQMSYNPIYSRKQYPQTNKCCYPPLPNSTWKQANDTAICTSHYKVLKGQAADMLDPVNTMRLLRRNMKTHSGIVRQYAGDLHGTFYQYPSGGPQACDQKEKKYNDFQYKNWFVNAASYKKKNIVIVIDHSGSMSSVVFLPSGKRTNGMTIAKEAARTVMETLNSDDYAGVVAFNHRAHGPKGCFGDQIAQANNKNRQIFTKFISNITPTGLTNYSASLSLAFKMMREAKSIKPKQFENSLDVIMFLTDGEPNDAFPDIKNVIEAGNNAMNNTVRLFIYGFGGLFELLPTKRISEIMTLADQNNRKLSFLHQSTALLHSTPWKGRGNKPVGKPGNFQTILSNQTSELRQIMGKYYLKYQPTFSSTPSFRLPEVDPHSGQLLVTASVPLKIRNQLIGVTATDVRFTSLFSDVSRFKIGSYSYAFLVTREGKVLSHRNFVKPSQKNPDINFVELDLAEPMLDNSTIENITENAATGSFKTLVPLSMSRGLSQLDGSYKLTLNATYYYRPVRLFEKQYSVVVVLFDEDRQYLKTQYLNNHKNVTQGNSAIYHRIDLKQPQSSTSSPSVCVTPFSVVKATNQAISTIKLSPNAFIDPDNYLNKKETTQNVTVLDRILAGGRNNTVLQPEALEEVKYTRAFEQLPDSNVTLSRYLATNAGVFRIAPGMVLGQGYDATDEPWFRQSSLYQDKCVVTRPGYSPTGDQTLASISKALHTPQGAMIGAVGGDVPISFLETLIETVIPDCTLPDTKCYLLDHSGYVVTEYGTPVGSGSQLYHKHIAELEPDIIADIQNRYTAVQVKWCLQPGTKKLSQMFYDISLSYAPLTSLPSSCVNYTLHPLHGTNLHFLVASNISACSNISNATPCVCTQTCVSCVSVNVTCQCPCLCMAGIDPCTNRHSKHFPPVTCPAPWFPTKPPKLTASLTPCTPDCHQRLNQSSCLANGGGCQWCYTTQGGTCLTFCPVSLSTSTTTTSTTTATTAIQTTTLQSCPISSQNFSIRVFSSHPPLSHCPISSKDFCDQHCTPQPTCIPGGDEERYTRLAAGLGGALAALGALSIIGAAFLFRTTPVPKLGLEPTKIRPVEPFHPNIYRASMGDDLMSSVGQQGAQLNEWNSNGADIYGRRLSVVSHQ